MIETFSNVTYGSVWRDVDDTEDSLERGGKLMDQANAIVDPFDGLVDDFGERDAAEEVFDAHAMWQWGDDKGPVWMR